MQEAVAATPLPPVSDCCLELRLRQYLDGPVRVPHMEAERLRLTGGDAAALASASAAASSKGQRQRHPVHDPPSRRACTLSLSPVRRGTDGVADKLGHRVVARRAGTQRPAARSRAARIAAAVAAHLCGVGRAGGIRRAGQPASRGGPPLF